MGDYELRGSSASLMSFITTACHGVFMSNTAEQRIVEGGLEVLVPMLKHLVRLIGDLGLFPFVPSGSDPGLAYVAFSRSQDVDWSELILKICSFSIAGIEGDKWIGRQTCVSPKAGS